MVLLQVLQVGNLVGAKVGDNVLPAQKLGDLCSLLLELIQALQNLLSLLGELLWCLLDVVDLGVQAGDVIGHVGGLQQLKLGLGHVHAVLLILIGDKLQQWEDQMSVEVLDELWQQVVLLCDLLWSLGLGGAVRVVGHNCDMEGMGIEVSGGGLRGVIEVVVGSL